MAERVHVTHPFGPLFDERSRVLILGSFPSPKSREQAFFYGHPQNRFWRVIAAVLDRPVPMTVDEKRAFCAEAGIALWDVLASCAITGSSDSSIKNAEVNDLSVILNTAHIRRIGVNGSTAYRLFEKYMSPQLEAYGLTMNDVVKLPSTSPANAAWSVERLTGSWRTLTS